MPSAPPLESVCIHEIEPFLRGPLPRKVPLTPALGVLLVCSALFWAACAAIGIATLSEGTKLIFLHYRGHTALAHVCDVVFEDGRRGPPALEPLSKIAGVAYAYRTEDGRERHGIVVISMQDAGGGFSSFAEPSSPRSEKLRTQRLEDVRRLVMSGHAWPVRYAWWGDRIVCEPWTRPPFGKTLLSLIVGVFVPSLVSFFALRLLRWLRTRAMLLRRGTATVGTILHKRSDAEDVPKFFVRYGYASGGAAFDREERCGPDEWRRFQVGESVTILYDATEPRRAALYRLLPFGRG